MNYSKYRKHPRVYSKKSEKEDDNSLILSGTAAAGILVFTLVAGVFSGYLLSRAID